MRWLCEALGVSRGSFHAWLTRRPSARARRDETYGARRVWYEVLAESVGCRAHPVERPKCELLPPRGRSMLLDKTAGVRHVLDRNLKGTAPNPKWIADFTHIWTAEGWLDVATVIDLLSRRVVGCG